MRDITIKGLFQGMAPVNSRLASSAYHAGEELRIINKRTGEFMVISGEFIKDGYKLKTGPYIDKFGNDNYYLIYYAWKPINKRQKKLL